MWVTRVLSTVGSLKHRQQIVYIEIRLMLTPPWVVCLIVTPLPGLTKLRGVEVCLLRYVRKEIVANTTLLNAKFLNYCTWTSYRKCFTCYRKLLRTLKEAERIRSKWWRHHWLHQRSLRTPSGRKQPCCRTWETGTQRVVCYPVFRRRGNCLAYLRVWRCLL